jgi:hypothetical protein
MKYDEIQNCLSKEACPFVQNAKICFFFFTNMVAGIIKLKSSNSQRQIAAKKRAYLHTIKWYEWYRCAFCSHQLKIEKAPRQMAICEMVRKFWSSFFVLL